MSKARHLDLSISDYHTRPEWSRSQVSDLIESPALFYGRHVAKPPIYPFKTSKEMEIGQVAHECLSNPGGLDGVCIQIPADVLDTRGYRKGNAYDEWSKEHDGLIQLKAEEFATVKAMVRSVYTHEESGNLLSTAMHYEFSLFWRDDESGLDLRARPDMICSAPGNKVIVVDFKTTRAINRNEFGKDAWKFGYHRQAHWYSEAVRRFGYEVQDFRFIAVDKSPAHECVVYRLREDAIELGRDENELSWLELRRRLDENDWINHETEGIVDVDLPGWAYPPIDLNVGGKTITV